MEPILERSQFLHRLRIEKRRADRSHLPLSIVLFVIREDPPAAPFRIQEFLKLLQRKTRETDIKGWLGGNVLGLILPDTNEKGAQQCIQKILNDNGNLSYSVLTGTYPDDLFQKLLGDENKDPDLFPIDLDSTFKSRPVQKVLKRIVDVVGALTGLILFSPIFFLTALAVKVTSPGPVIFKQERLGEKGVRFLFCKFRSMYWGVDDRIHREYTEHLIKGNLEKINQGDKDKPLYKMKSDPRITRVGKIIRKTSLDELPQFINVLKGEMSLVGPRPPLPYEVEKYKPWHLRRILEVKPGITGLWQVDGRSKTSFDDMVRLDLKYAQEWSLWLDLKILLKTVRAVLRPSGAE